MSLTVAVTLMARIRTDFDALSAKMSRQTPAASVAREQLDTLQAKVDQLEFERRQSDEHHTTERRVLDMRVRQLEHDLHAREAAFAEQALAATDFAQALQHQLDDAQQQQSALVAAADEASQYADNIARQLAQTHEQLQGERESFAMQSGAFEGQLMAERAEAAQREANLRSEIETAREHAATDGDSSLAGDFQLLQDRFAELDQNYRALQLEADTLRSELNVAAAVLEEERVHAAQKNDALAIMGEEKHLLEARVHEADFQASKHAEEVASLQRQLTDAEHALRLREASSAKLQSQLDELSRGSAALDERRVKELADVTRTAEENKAAAALLTAELTDLHSSLDAAEAENDRLRKMVPNEKMIQKLVQATREQQKRQVETEKVRMLNEMETQGALAVPVAQLKPLLKTLPSTSVTATTTPAVSNTLLGARPKLLSLHTTTVGHSAVPLVAATTTGVTAAPKLLKLQSTLTQAGVKLAPAVPTLKTLGGSKLLHAGATNVRLEDKENAINA